MPDLRTRVLAGVVALVLGLGLAACGSEPDGGQGGPLARVSTGPGDGFHGVRLDDPYVVPDIPLTDTSGEPYSIATSDTPLQLVFFGYTNCPDICQIVMSTVASSLTRLDPDVRKQVSVVFVTTDPARDDERVLRTYLDRFDPGFVGLTGPLPKIVELATAMKVFLEKGAKLASGGYEVDHSTYVFGVTEGGARLVWTQGTSPAQLASDIARQLS